MYYSILRAGAQRELKKIGQADLVIGLPTYKNPQQAAHVARIALAGAAEYYPEMRTVLVNADAGYSAETRRAVKSECPAEMSNIYVVSGRYEGVLGQGNAVAAILDAALALDAKAIVILDSQTETLTPSWIAGLATLIVEDKADLVLPRYRWSIDDPASAFNDLIIYPLFRALWGRSVRYPGAPDFALSARLAVDILDQDVWETEVANFGVTPWLTTYALLNQWQVAQSALGEKRLGSYKNGKFKQQQERFAVLSHDMLSVMFRFVYDYREVWGDVDKFYSQSTLTQYAAPARIEPVVERDCTDLLDALAIGWIEYRTLWQCVLTPDNLTFLEALAALPPDRFYFPPDLWARIIYDFAVVFNKGECDPYQVVKSFFPIYQGRLAAFWQEIAGLSLVGREGTIAAQAVEFEEIRAYLRIRWHTYQPWLYT